MERESLLVVLIILLGGATLQLFAPWPVHRGLASSAREWERTCWRQLWQPLAAPLLVALWLCGWALAEPDPVRDRVGGLVFVLGVPFALLAARTLLRAGWSLLTPAGNVSIATVGILRPHVVVSSAWAHQLESRALTAALAHEQAHVRHHDPLRIWLAQFATDLQWPWPFAQRRLRTWLAALEQARDDEARAAGADGADLAAAILATARFCTDSSGTACARLTGEERALQARIESLLQPLPTALTGPLAGLGVLRFFLPAAALALATGFIGGERIIRALLALLV